MNKTVSVCAMMLASLIAASAAEAQPYGPPAQITVYGHRLPRERSEIGAPIENISLSRAVRFDDLDLRTDWGAEALRQRILFTARNLCRQLNAAYPDQFYLPTADSLPCYRLAVDDAMTQADDAIADARGYAP